MYDEDDLVMISALQHYLFCPRRCALLFTEQQWADNVYTVEGTILHERVHTPGKESRSKIKTEFDVAIRSFTLGVVGRADIVEFHQQDNGLWQPYPVEYKRGQAKKDDPYKVQLCAQAICLAEMLQVEVPVGALYYGQKKRRMEIVFDDDLCRKTEETAKAVHHLLESGHTPLPVYHKGCESCSFLENCLPQIMGKRGRVARYLKTLDEL